MLHVDPLTLLLNYFKKLFQGHLVEKHVLPLLDTNDYKMATPEGKRLKLFAGDTGISAVKKEAKKRAMETLRDIKIGRSEKYGEITEADKAEYNALDKRTKDVLQRIFNDGFPVGNEIIQGNIVEDQLYIEALIIAEELGDVGVGAVNLPFERRGERFETLKETDNVFKPDYEFD